MKDTFDIKREDFDEAKVVDLYMKLGIDITNTLDIGALGKKYQDMIDAVESECYATAAYVNR